MPKTIKIEKLPNSLRLTRLSEAGQPEEMVKGGFNDSADIKKAARRLGVPASTLLAFIAAYRDTGGHDELSVADEKSVPGLVRVRGVREAGEAAVSFDAPTCYDAFCKALAYQDHEAPEPLIVWDSLTTLAAVDVDYKPEHRPSKSRLDTILRQLHPTPPASWITHGGGLRAIYHDLPGWTAEELAAVAGVWIAYNEPLGRVEVKRSTRHPAYKRGKQKCSEVYRQPADLDLTHLGGLIAQRVFDPQEIDEWLEDHGMVRGTTHEHTFCPINPSEHHKKEVFAGDEGVFCYLCQARGAAFRGQRRPGFVPYSALLGDLVPTPLKACVAKFCHWTHAEAVFDAVLPGLSFARAVYAALLKLKHSDDPRVLPALRNRSFLRLGREWATILGEPLDSAGLTKNLAGLPACIDNVDGELVGNAERLEMFRQPIDLKSWGYPALSPIYGCKVHGCFLPPLSDDRLPYVIQPPELADVDKSSRRPKYIHKASRPSLLSAWRRIEQVYPGINRKAVYLFLAAKACFESGGGTPSILFLEGASGSGKSQTAHIAAAIAGDGATEAGYRPDRDHIYRTVAEASRRGSFCVFNEIVKHTKEANKGIIEGLDFLLTLTPDQTYHKLYLGPTVLGAIPVIVLTDTTLPTEVVQDKQIARRVIHVFMGSTLKRWEQSLAETGVHSTRRLRLADEPTAQACDVILSNVIDRWFRASPAPTLSEIANDLGFKLLSESDAYASFRRNLRDLFVEILKHPEPAAADRRYCTEGLKVLDERGLEGTVLGGIWSSVHDQDNWTEWSRANSEDWAEITGWPQPLECVVRPLRQGHKSKVCIGFREVKSRRWVTNMSLMPQATGTMGAVLPNMPGEEGAEVWRATGRSLPRFS